MSQERILISQLSEQINQPVLIKGWMHKKIEVSKHLCFLTLRDRTGLVQIVLEGQEKITQIHSLQPGSVIEALGTVKSEPKAKGGLEVHANYITIVVPVLEQSPIEIDKQISHESEHYNTLFEHRVINLRNPQEQSIFKIQAELTETIRRYLRRNDFVEFRSPKLLAEATEGGAEVFKLEYFDQTATLAQSAQFYKQIMVGVFERVYEIGATYRAEPSFTPRHMTEFTTVDVEMGFIKDFEEVLQNAEGLLTKACDEIWAEFSCQLQLWESTKPQLTETLPRVSLHRVHKLYLQEKGIDYTLEKDPKPEEEKFICEYSLEHWGSEAVFITEFPASEMKFYHFLSPQNPDVCERADLIFRGVEIATLSQREHRFETLVKQLKEAGGDPTNPGFKYYLQAFRHGMPPHGGFGLGLERLVQKIIGLKSVKEAALFPRDVKRLAP